MRFRFLMLVLAILGLVAATGCEVSVNEGDGGVDLDADSDTDSDTDSDSDADMAGFGWQWMVVDGDGNTLTCADAGAEYALVTVTDAASVEHKIYWLCSDGAGQTDERVIAPGMATITQTLLTADDTPLSQTVPFTFDFKAGDNDLGPTEFEIALWDPFTGADSSLTWEWRKATKADWVDPYADAEPFSAQICTDLGIDYAQLWLWNPDFEYYWTDPAVTEFKCDSVDQPNDDEFWGTDAYSGGFINDFLVADQYQMFLGFYAEAAYNEGGDKKTDLLMYFDEAGPGKDIDGVLAADDTFTDGGTNLFITVFDTDQEEMKFGILKVNLIWEQSAGTPYENCENSNVQEMGFLLRSDGWVAAEVPLSDGLECLDWLVFEDVPVLENPYELLVSGISKENAFLWYNLCTGLTPEEVATVEEATGFSCNIKNQLGQ